ncbi:MAG: hypothetical protein KDA44_14240 [Planctomycetales bacterium]|nr:hypothetical protein [Planctomycetales bacterium]
MTTAKITDIAGTPGIALTPEVLKQLNATVGDDIQIVADNGGVTLRKVSANDTDTDRQLKIAEHVMEQRDEVLRRLAE